MTTADYERLSKEICEKIISFYNDTYQFPDPSYLYVWILDYIKKGRIDAKFNAINKLFNCIKINLKKENFHTTLEDFEFELQRFTLYFNALSEPFEESAEDFITSKEVDFLFEYIHGNYPNKKLKLRTLKSSIITIVQPLRSY